MKITRIEIEQFLKFRERIVVDGLTDGLNLLFGPNEAGKSTIAQALRRVFFERHRVRGEIQQLMCPSGNTDAAPYICVDFELDGKPCRAAKTFFRQPRSELKIGAESWNGDDADDQLASRFGFEFPGKGQSRSETHGIPGLMWITQGECVDLIARIADAKEPLRARLMPALGQLTSSAAGILLKGMEGELAKLKTSEGRSRGELKKAESTTDETRNVLADLQQKAKRFRETADQFAADLKEQRRMEEAKPWAKLQAELEGTKAKLVAVGPMRDNLAGLQKQYQLLSQQVAGLVQSRDQHSKDLQQLEADRTTFARMDKGLEPLEQDLKTAIETRDKARVDKRSAAQALKDAHHLQWKLRLERELVQSQNESTKIGKILEDDQRYEKQLQDLRMQAHASKLKRKDIDGLEQLEKQRAKVAIQLESAATRIAFSLAPDHRIDAGDAGILEGDGQRLLTSPATLRIPNVGSLTIIPGGEDINALQGPLVDLDEKITTLRVAMGVADSAEAHERDRHHQNVTSQAEALEQERKVALEHETHEHWVARQAAVESEITEKQRQLKDVPEAPAGALSPGDAQRGLDNADDTLESAEDNFSRAQGDRAERAAQLSAMKRSLEAASKRLENDSEKREVEQRVQDLDTAVASRAQVEAQINEAERQLEAMGEEVLSADEERLTQALASLDVERINLRRRIAANESTLSALGADGVDERVEQANFAHASAQDRLDQLRLRADALSLLCERLRTLQDQAAAKLYGPLSGKIDPYMRLLFPNSDTTATIEDLGVTRVSRDGESLPLDAYSYGTREQLAVIMRIAYADLLREVGQPTLLMLDDALVHSDPDRREQMKRVLHLAAQHHQILLFTCDRDVWISAGANNVVNVGAVVALAASR